MTQETSERLRRLLAKNPVVKSHFDAWYAGMHRSFEDMAIALVCDLAEQSDRQHAALVKKAIEEPQIFMKNPL